MTSERDDTEARTEALKLELSQPSAYSYLIGNSDVLEPEPPAVPPAYDNETIFSYDGHVDADDDIFEAYVDDETGERGYLRRKRTA